MSFDGGKFGLRLRRLFLPAVFLMLCTVTISCNQKKEETSQAATSSDKKWNRASAEWDYRLMQTELSLAKTLDLCLVLDLKHGKLKLKLKGAVVWNYPMNFSASDSDKVSDFMHRFLGDNNRLVRPLADKHLFAAERKTPDSVLAIVGKAVNVNPELLQRELPERFQLIWDDNMILEVRTDITGKPLSKLGNAVIEIGQALKRPFGETMIVLSMRVDDALTLYRAATPGMPTLIYPSY